MLINICSAGRYMVFWHAVFPRGRQKILHIPDRHADMVADLAPKGFYLDM